MIEWHKPNLDPETIAKIIREGREENDKKFESYAEYVGYIGKDNDRILKEYDHDHSKCEPNELTKEAMDFEVQKNAMIDYQEVLDELRKDRDEKDQILEELIMESIEDNRTILDKLGSDIDEDGVPYWLKAKEEQIKGRDDV